MDAKRDSISQEMLPEELETVSAGIGAAAQGDAALIDKTRNAKASGISLRNISRLFPSRLQQRTLHSSPWRKIAGTEFRFAAQDIRNVSKAHLVPF